MVDVTLSLSVIDMDCSGAAPFAESRSMGDPAPARPDLAELRQRIAKYQAAENADHSGELKGWRGRPLWTKVTNVTQSDVDHGRVPSDLIAAAVNALPLLLDWIEAADVRIAELERELGETAVLIPDGTRSSDVWYSHVMDVLREPTVERFDSGPSGSPEPPKP